MGSGEREIGSKSSSLPQDPGDLAGLYKTTFPLKDIFNKLGQIQLFHWLENS